jgi:hypothetical protein
MKSNHDKSTPALEITQLSELAEADSELAKLLAHEDANYDALADEDEAEALRRWSGSRRGDAGTHPFGIPWAIGWVVRGLFGNPSGADRRSKVRK